MKVQLLCGFLVIATAVAVTIPKSDIFATFKGSQEDCNVCLYEFTQILKTDKLQWLASLVVPLACSLTGLLQDKCLKFLDYYVDIAINMTIALGPEGICEDIGSCNKTSMTQAFMEQARPNNLQRRTVGRRTGGLGNAADCNVCKYEFTQILDKDKLQWVAKLIVPLACSITGPVAPKCEAFLDKYIDEFINMTIALGPEGICETIGSCPKPSAPMQKAIEMPAPAAAIQADVPTTTFNPNCAGCKMGADYLIEFLGSRDAINQFDAIIDNEVCNAKGTPDFIKQICETFTTNIIPTILTILTTDLDVNTICQSVC